MELTGLALPHTGLEDCLNMLLSCFRKRMSASSASAAALHVVIIDLVSFSPFLFFPLSLRPSSHITEQREQTTGRTRMQPTCNFFPFFSLRPSFSRNSVGGRHWHTYRLPELIGSLKLGNVWVFVQPIHRPGRTKNQLYKNQNID